MSTTTQTDPSPTLAPRRRQRVGLALAGLFFLTNLPSAFVPGSPDGEVGPPFEILLADTLLAAVGLVAVLAAWRTGRRAALSVLAGCVVLILLTMVPAFFVDVPAWVKSLTALSVLWGLACVVLSLGGRSGR
ncbi:hypothetical protein [Nocardioides marmoraquaticus]